MKNTADVRKRLESASFPDLGSMMEGYAQAAADLGRTQFAQKLDSALSRLTGSTKFW